MLLNRGTVTMTTDGGATWRDAPGLPPPESFFSDVQFLDGLHGWIPINGIGDKSGLYRTSDGGLTWLQSRFAPPNRGSPGLRLPDDVNRPRIAMSGRAREQT